EGHAHPHEVLQQAADDGTHRDASPLTCLHHAHGVPETVAGDDGHHHRRGSRDHSCHETLHEPQHRQFLDGSCQPHQADEDGSTYERTHDHRLASVAVGYSAPDG